MAKKKKKDKVGKKVSCTLCKAQYNSFCTIKRVSVSLNKKRHCDRYDFDESKVKDGVPIPTKRITFREKEVIRKERKEQLKELKDQIKKQGGGYTAEISTPVKDSRIYKPYGNEKYPLTGDLSRFTTTGSSDDDKDKT